MADHLVLTAVRKSYGDQEVLHGVDLTAHQGEFISLIGPSGSGKTTMLRIISGTEQPTGGTVTLRGHDITDRPPHQRGFSMVFQHFALFPHKDVFHNVSYGLELRRVARDEVRRRVMEMLERVSMAQFADRDVGRLSGGQRQRVAIARALVVEPELVLLDEPTGSLDAKLRLQMQTELKTLHRDLGLTLVHVTHNQSEALALADRVFVMNEGRIEQTGSPTEIFTSPATRFVAEFVGRNNLVDGVVGDGRFRSPLGAFSVNGDVGARTGPCTAVMRADMLHVGSAPDGAETITARLDALEYAGSVVTWFVSVGDAQLTLDVRADESAALAPRIGEHYPLWWRAEDLHFLTDEKEEGS
jgi:ABC-type Fe3+/spermidine/putrescine transport system ATPase subunit